MVVFGLSELSWRLPRVMLLTTLVVVGMMGYLWSKGKAFKPTRAWGYFPLSLLSGIIVSALLTVLYCKINPMVSLIDSSWATLRLPFLDCLFIPLSSSPINIHLHSTFSTLSVALSQTHQPPFVTRTQVPHHWSIFFTLYNLALWVLSHGCQTRLHRLLFHRAYVCLFILCDHYGSWNPCLERGSTSSRKCGQYARGRSDRTPIGITPT